MLDADLHERVFAAVLCDQLQLLRRGIDEQIERAEIDGIGEVCQLAGLIFIIASLAEFADLFVRLGRNRFAGLAQDRLDARGKVSLGARYGWPAKGTGGCLTALRSRA